MMRYNIKITEWNDPKPYLTSVVEWSFDLTDGIEVKIAVKQIDD